jgi:hypothetical protein
MRANGVAHSKPLSAKLAPDERGLEAWRTAPVPSLGGGPKPLRRESAVLDRDRVALEPGAKWHLGVVVHNRDLEKRMKPAYTAEDLAALRTELERLGATHVGLLSTGLPRAAEQTGAAHTDEEGYDHTWNRDAVLVGASMLSTGKDREAGAIARALMKYMSTPNQMRRMKRGARPHIKFNGETLSDMKGRWGHAQNDALGLTLWYCFTAARKGIAEIEDRDLETLAVLTKYLAKLDVTQDKEDGHWEESGANGGRVMLSSLVCVLHGLRQLVRWADEKEAWKQTSLAAKKHLGERVALEKPEVLELIARIERKIHQLAPFESKGEGFDHREADLALTTALFLDLEANPTDRVFDQKAYEQILTNLEKLRGTHGDRRYLDDGYFGAYSGETSLAHRKQLHDGSLDGRVSHGLIQGAETQWTLGAPILSVIYGRLFEETGDARFREAQTHQFNRALGMVTGKESWLGPGTIPESYMPVRVPAKQHPALRVWTFQANPLPLNWSKANLALALERMERSAASRRAGAEGERSSGPRSSAA